MGMKARRARTITIQTDDGPQLVTPVFWAATYAVHLAYLSTGPRADYWTVTHTPSGMAMVFAASRASGERAARLLADSGMYLLDVGANGTWPAGHPHRKAMHDLVVSIRCAICHFYECATCCEVTP